MKKEVSFLICGILIGALAATCGFALFLRGADDASTGSDAKVVLKLGKRKWLHRRQRKDRTQTRTWIGCISSGSQSYGIYERASARTFRRDG